MVNGLGAVGPPVPERPALQNIQHLHQVGTAGGGRRHGHDLVAPVAATHRFALYHPVAAQVVQGHGAAVPGHFGSDFLGDLTFVERLGPVLGDQAQRMRQVFLHQPLARAQRSAVFPEDGLGGGPAAHGGLGPFQRLGQGGADRVALFGQVNGRLQHMRQRQRAPLLQGVGQARHGAGHANGMVGVERFAVDHLALGIQVHAALGAGRGGFAKIQRHALAAGRLMHQHEAAAANVARVGQGHGQGKAHGHGGIHGVASGLEHL